MPKGASSPLAKTSLIGFSLFLCRKNPDPTPPPSAPETRPIGRGTDQSRLVEFFGKQADGKAARYDRLLIGRASDDPHAVRERSGEIGRGQGRRLCMGGAHPPRGGAHG